MLQITHQDKPVVFIADLHLSEDRPDINAAFHRFIEQLSDIDALYIMGDFVEIWLGDDLCSAFHSENARILKSASQRFPIYFTHGNRDFLIGKRFAKESGMTLLPEIQPITLFGTKTLIMHGDSLCIDDVAYQKYRRYTFNKALQSAFTKLPKKFRHAVYAKIKKASHHQKANKNATIMDVAPREVERVLEHYQAKRIIHGHTHRPKLHNLPESKQRWVVGDWHRNTSALFVTRNSAELIEIPLNQ